MKMVKNKQNWFDNLFGSIIMWLAIGAFGAVCILMIVGCTAAAWLIFKEAFLM